MGKKYYLIIGVNASSHIKEEILHTSYRETILGKDVYDSEGRPICKEITIGYYVLNGKNFLKDSFFYTRVGKFTDTCRFIEKTPFELCLIDTYLHNFYSLDIFFTREKKIIGKVIAFAEQSVFFTEIPCLKLEVCKNLRKIGIREEPFLSMVEEA